MQNRFFFSFSYSCVLWEWEWPTLVDEGELGYFMYPLLSKGVYEFSLWLLGWTGNPMGAPPPPGSNRDTCAVGWGLPFWPNFKWESSCNEISQLKSNPPFSGHLTCSFRLLLCTQCSWFFSTFQDFLPTLQLLACCGEFVSPTLLFIQRVSQHTILVGCVHGIVKYCVNLGGQSQFWL